MLSVKRAGPVNMRNLHQLYPHPTHAPSGKGLPMARMHRRHLYLQRAQLGDIRAELLPILDEERRPGSTIATPSWSPQPLNLHWS